MRHFADKACRYKTGWEKEFCSYKKRHNVVRRKVLVTL